jgi:hypothetical protein
VTPGADSADDLAVALQNLSGARRRRPLRRLLPFDALGEAAGGDHGRAYADGFRQALQFGGRGDVLATVALDHRVYSGEIGGHGGFIRRLDSATEQE